MPSNPMLLSWHMDVPGSIFFAIHFRHMSLRDCMLFLLLYHYQGPTYGWALNTDVNGPFIIKDSSRR